MAEASGLREVGKLESMAYAATGSAAVTSLHSRTCNGGGIAKSDDPLQSLEQMTARGPHVKQEPGSVHKICPTSVSNSQGSYTNYQLSSFQDQWNNQLSLLSQQIGANPCSAHQSPFFGQLNPAHFAAGHPSLYDPTSRNGLPYMGAPEIDVKAKGKGRQTYSRYQTQALEQTFRDSRYVSKKKRSELETITGLTDRQIKIWYQNRRMKQKKEGIRHVDGESQQSHLPHPPTPTSSALTKADARVNGSRSGTNLCRTGPETPPSSRGLDSQSASFFGQLPMPYSHLTQGVTASAVDSDKFHKFPTHSQPQSSISFNGYIDAWNAGMFSTDPTLQSMFQQPNFAWQFGQSHSSINPFGHYAGTSVNQAGYQQYTSSSSGESNR